MPYLHPKELLCLCSANTDALSSPSPCHLSTRAPHPRLPRALVRGILFPLTLVTSLTPGSSEMTLTFFSSVWPILMALCITWLSVIHITAQWYSVWSDCFLDWVFERNLSCEPQPAPSATAAPGGDFPKWMPVFLIDMYRSTYVLFCFPCFICFLFPNFPT